MREQEENERNNRIGLSTRYLTRILLVVLVLAVLTCGFRMFRLQQVIVDGLTRYTEAEFREKLEDTLFYSLTPVFCIQDTFAQKTIPFIEKYEITYVNRTTARIVVHEKRVTGGVLIMGRYMYFDKDGIVVESCVERLPDIPVISGLSFDEIVLYQKLKVQKESLYDTILQLTRLIEQNGIEVEEISFDSNYEVTLYSGENSILLGKRSTYDEQLNALQGILHAMQGRTGILDMRKYSKETPDVILK